MILKNGYLIPPISKSKVKFNHAKMVALLLLMVAAGLFISNPGRCGNSVADEIISLDLVEQPLGEVLDDIAAATGYRFIFDASWENFLISASIKNEPLHKGLKRILGKLNNVIIYRSDRTIKIIIFDEDAASGNRSDGVVDRTADDESVQRSDTLPASSWPRSPPAEQELSDAENDNRLSEESDATAAEPDEAAPGDEEPTADAAGETAADLTGKDASAQNEEATEVGEESPDQPETDNQ